MIERHGARISKDGHAILVSLELANSPLYLLADREKTKISKDDLVILVSLELANPSLPFLLILAKQG
jgi:hypothetical protein